MSEQAVAVVEGQPLSQVERVVDTFVAPTKTFTDILRNRSWWLPYLVLMLGTFVLAFSIQAKVGWSQLADNQIRTNPKAEAKQADMSPDQIALQRRITAGILQGTLFGAPITNLLFIGVFALVLWPTINFVFGGKASFGSTWTMCTYAFLPTVIKSLLAAVLLYAGRAADSFTMETMLGSSAGYYINDPGPLKTFLQGFDLFGIWMMILLSIGLATIGQTKRSAGYIAVFGWFAVLLLFQTAIAAI